MKTIMVVAPHTDDEVLGAGGYLLKHKAQGDRIVWLNVTNAKEEFDYSHETVEYWNQRIEKVSEGMGFDEVFDLGFEPAALEKVGGNTIVSSIRKVIDSVQPNIVLLPFYGDVHSDHRIVFEATMACCKAFRCKCVETIMCMEIISETDYAISDNGFIPNYFVDISDYIEKKIEILKIYDSEVLTPPFPRSLEAVIAQARFRGASCFAEYAEGFRIIKSIER